MMGPGEALVGAVAFSAMGLIGFTLARAFAQRIAGGAAPPRELEAMRDEMDQMRHELEGMRAQLGQLEELEGRVDFAERMLAQVREKNALPPGGRS